MWMGIVNICLRNIEGQIVHVLEVAPFQQSQLCSLTVSSFPIAGALLVYIQLHVASQFFLHPLPPFSPHPLLPKCLVDTNDVFSFLPLDDERFIQAALFFFKGPPR